MLIGKDEESKVTNDFWFDGALLAPDLKLRP